MSTEVIVNLRHEAQAYNEKCAEDSSVGMYVCAGVSAVTAVLVGVGGVRVRNARPIKLLEAQKGSLATCAEMAKEMGLTVKDVPAYCCDGYAFKNMEESDRLLKELKTAGVPDEFIQEYEYKTYMRQRADSLRASAKELSDGANKTELFAQADQCEDVAKKATGKERVVKVLNPKEVAKAHEAGRLVLPAGVDEAKLAAKMDDFKSSAVSLEDEILRSFGKSADEITDIKKAKFARLKKFEKKLYSWRTRGAKTTKESASSVVKKLVGFAKKHPVISGAFVLGGVYGFGEIKDVSKEYIPFIGGSEQGGASLPAISEEILKEIEQNPEKYALDAEMAKTTVNNIRSTEELDSEQYRAFYTKSKDISLEHGNENKVNTGKEGGSLTPTRETKPPKSQETQEGSPEPQETQNWDDFMNSGVSRTSTLSMHSEKVLDVAMVDQPIQVKRGGRA